MTTPPLTGPEAIQHALSRLDLEALDKEAREVIRLKKKTARPRAVRVINLVQGLKRNGVTPSDMMITQVPVIPTKFRPFSIIGNTFTPGDANELYRDLVEYKRLYGETEGQLGKEGSNEVYGDMAKAVKALYGYGDSPNPKTLQRSVKGFFEVATGSSPKHSYFQSKMLSKPMDTVGRSVIVPDADYGMNEIGIPHDMGWKMYAQHVQRRLVRGGMAPSAALKNVLDRTPQAAKALEVEMADRPVVYSRAPAWHKYNVIGGYAKLVDGDAIKVNTYITDGISGDFDGDTLNVHVPVLPETIKEVKEKLMPDKMLFSVKDPDKVVPVPKHEQQVGVWLGGDKPSVKRHTFATNEEAMKAIQEGRIDLNDDVVIGAGKPPH